MPLAPAPVEEIIVAPLPEETKVVEVEPEPTEPDIPADTNNLSAKQRPSSVGSASYNVYYKEGQTTENMLVANYARRVFYV